MGNIWLIGGARQSCGLVSYVFTRGNLEDSDWGSGLQRDSWKIQAWNRRRLV